MNKIIQNELKKQEIRENNEAKRKVLKNSKLSKFKTNNFVNNKKTKSLRAIRLSDIESKPIDWLWKPFLAIGTFNILEGEEGIGKTFLALALACAIASGKGLPQMSESEYINTSNVILISAEDSFAHVIKPRLESMNAPTEKIIAIDELFTLNDEGVFLLSKVISEYEPKLLIIDPLFSYTGRVNLNNDNEIRSITNQLKKIAEKYQCTILGIRHIGKSKGMGDPRSAGLNGVGWAASARSVLLVGKNPEKENQRAICQIKNNLAEKAKKAIGYEIKENKFYWTGESDLNARIMLSQVGSGSNESKSEAISFLKESLKDGKKLAEVIQSEAKIFGISKSTLNRAKDELNIKSFKEGFKPSQWYWELPKLSENCSEDTQISGFGNLRLNNSNKSSYNSGLAEDTQIIKSDKLQKEEKDDFLLNEGFFDDWD